MFDINILEIIITKSNMAMAILANDIAKLCALFHEEFSVQTQQQRKWNELFPNGKPKVWQNALVWCQGKP